MNAPELPENDDAQIQREIDNRISEIVCGSNYKTPIQKIRWVAGWIAALFAVVTVGFLVLELKQQLARGSIDHVSKSSPERWSGLILAIFWAIVPPFYFWLDQFVLWEIENRLPKNRRSFQNFEEFMRGLDTSRNIWLGIAALVAAYYFAP